MCGLLWIRSVWVCICVIFLALVGASARGSEWFLRSGEEPSEGLAAVFGSACAKALHLG